MQFDEGLEFVHLQDRLQLLVAMFEPPILPTLDEPCCRYTCWSSQAFEDLEQPCHLSGDAEDVHRHDRIWYKLAHESDDERGEYKGQPIARSEDMTQD